MFSQLRDANIDAQQNDAKNQVPRSVLPPRLATPIPSTKTIRSIQAISGVTAGPGQTSIIRIPTSVGSGLAVCGSFYLKFKLHVTQAADTWGFSQGGDASSLIQRLTVQQGAILEQINNYGKYVNSIIKPYCVAPQYNNIDASVSFGAMTANQFKPIAFATSNTTATVTNALVYNPNTNFAYNQTTSSAPVMISVPIACGLLNNSENSYLPMEMINQNLELVIDFAQLNDAFMGVTSAVTDYTVSELSLVYETVKVSEDYYNSIRQAMARGALWSIPFQSCISSQVADSSSLSYSFSLNVSSLDAFFHNKIIGEFQGSTLTSKYTTASSGAYAYSLAGGTKTNGIPTTMSRLQLLADGEQVFQMPDNMNPAIQLRETVRAICGSVGDANYGVPFQQMGNYNLPGSFLGQFYTDGWNLRSWNETSLVNTGRPTSLLVYNKDDTSGRSTDTNYFFAVCSFIAVIDASGSISLIR